MYIYMCIYIYTYTCWEEVIKKKPRLASSFPADVIDICLGRAPAPLGPGGRRGCQHRGLGKCPKNGLTEKSINYTGTIKLWLFEQCRN